MSTRKAGIKNHNLSEQKNKDRIRWKYLRRISAKNIQSVGGSEWLKTFSDFIIFIKPG